MREIAVYKDRSSNLLSFTQPLYIWEPTVLLDVKNGLEEKRIEEGMEILRSSSPPLTWSKFYYTLRVFNWNRIQGDHNLRVQTHCLGNYDPPRGSCLGTSCILDISTQYPNAVLRELSEKGIKHIGQIVLYKKIYPSWKQEHSFPQPFQQVGEVVRGHPLHYPHGEYKLFSVGESFNNPDDLFELFETLNGEDDLHLLLYPSGDACITNGIAGNPTFWITCKKTSPAPAGDVISELKKKLARRNKLIKSLRQGLKK